MNKNLKDDLDSIFSSQSPPADAIQYPTIKIEHSEEDFVQAFYVLEDSVITPALSEIGEYVKAKGCDYRIDSHDERVTADGRRESAQVTLRLLIGATPGHTQAYEYPHFKVMCDPAARSVIFHQSTISTHHSGTSGTVGQSRLEDVSVELLQEKLVAFVRSLFGK